MKFSLWQTRIWSSIVRFDDHVWLMSANCQKNHSTCFPTLCPVFPDAVTTSQYDLITPTQPFNGTEPFNGTSTTTTLLPFPDSINGTTTISPDAALKKPKRPNLTDGTWLLNVFTLIRSLIKELDLLPTKQSETQLCTVPCQPNIGSGWDLSLVANTRMLPNSSVISS